MRPIKLFYSYSRKDEEFKDELQKHLATLKKNGLICDWHDRDIDAGANWTEEIEKHISTADIILFLMSPDFIASDACQEEVRRTMKLKKEIGTVAIPIILRQCSWEDIPEIKSIQALPKNANPVSTWCDRDAAWKSVYDGIKSKVESLCAMPKLKDNFKRKLSFTPMGDLDKIFVYPDMMADNDSPNLEGNERDAEQLTNLKDAGCRFVLLEGAEQSGKTALCNMLFLRYWRSGFYPIVINGKHISGKANITEIVNNAYREQYDSVGSYFGNDQDKRVLLIDDCHDKTAKRENFATFLASIKERFCCAFVFVDALSNLSEKSIQQNHFHGFDKFSIKYFGYQKRNELIRKCISLDEGADFNFDNPEHTKRLDRDVEFIDNVIRANIVPSQPILVITIFNTIESTSTRDLSATSYGYCYQAMLTLSLGKAGVVPEDVDAYFNFMTELAYCMFSNKSKNISASEKKKFIRDYDRKFVSQWNFFTKLESANIITSDGDACFFRYIYVYYYFVARHLARKIDNANIKGQIDSLMGDLHLKDNANIIIFLTHHTNNEYLISKVLQIASSAFNKFAEISFEGTEKEVIGKLCIAVRVAKLPSGDHDVESKRAKELERKDRVADIVDDDDDDENLDGLSIEIRKTAKSIEIMGQILKNQYGSLEKDKMANLFVCGQNAGLRLLKGFISLIDETKEDFENYIAQILSSDKHQSLSKEETRKRIEKIVSQVTYTVIFGWMHKIVDALGYEKLISIADVADKKTSTVASKLINLSVHVCYTKRIDMKKIGALHREFHLDGNHQAINIMKDVVIRHIYMHNVDYKDKQKIKTLFNIPIQSQIAVQIKRGTN